MKSIVNFFLCLAIAFSVSGSLLISPVYAQATVKWGNRCVKTVEVINPGMKKDFKYDDIATIQGIECVFYNVLQVIVLIAGLVFLFMFISGGFKYLFSGGEQKSVAAASSTLTSALIGLVGIIASWLILSFIATFTGINVIDFIIPG